jgi:hypothetical protein
MTGEEADVVLGGGAAEALGGAAGQAVGEGARQANPARLVVCGQAVQAAGVALTYAGVTYGIEVIHYVQWVELDT